MPHFENISEDRWRIFTICQKNGSPLPPSRKCKGCNDRNAMMEGALLDNMPDWRHHIQKEMSERKAMEFMTTARRLGEAPLRDREYLCVLFPWRFQENPDDAWLRQSVLLGLGLHPSPSHTHSTRQTTSSSTSLSPYSSSSSRQQMRYSSTSWNQQQQQKKKKQSRQKEENEKKETGTNKHWREKRNSQQRKANENETEEKAEEQTDTDVISNCSKKVLFDSCMNALQINLHTSHLRIITNQFQSSRKKKDKWILLNSFCLNSLK